MQLPKTEEWSEVAESPSLTKEDEWSEVAKSPALAKVADDWLLEKETEKEPG